MTQSPSPDPKVSNMELKTFDWASVIPRMHPETGKQVRALGLLSGGLDSCLAALLLKSQGIDVTCICFQSPFFGPANAKRFSASHQVALRVIDFTDPHLVMVKAPPHGWGQNMNPCIDCHAMMFQHAGEVLQQEGFDFLFSGEVLNQRPMSQNRQSLDIVAQQGGWGNKILRPLCALTLPATEMEKAGIVDRQRLKGFNGRSRKPQQALAEVLGLTEYPSSAGGCALTDPQFSCRLRDLFDVYPNCGGDDCLLLRHGRYMDIGDGHRVMIGRNEEENTVLREMAENAGRWVVDADAPVLGPLAVIMENADAAEPLSDKHMTSACAIVASFGKGKDEDTVKVSVFREDEKREFDVMPMEVAVRTSLFAHKMGPKKRKSSKSRRR